MKPIGDQREEAAPPGTAWRARMRPWGTVVCIATADFSAPLWTNKQHIMSRLASEVPVVYVDSLGLRRPRITPTDVHRMARRLWRGRRPPRQAYGAVPTGLEVRSPVVIPFHGSPVARRVNRRLLSNALSATIAASRSPRLLWTYNPFVVDELSGAAFDACVYHCVDDFASMPRIPAKAVRDAEQRLVRQADVVFVSSDALARRLTPLSPQRVHLVGNVADAEHFAQAQRAGRIPPDLRAIPEPRAVFVGSLSDYKVDWNLIAHLAGLRPDWSFVLIGPVTYDGAKPHLGHAVERKNVHALGYRPYEMLPQYLRGARIGLIPYRLTPHTASVFPLKTWEYLAAGVHVVSTDLPALRAARPPVTFASDAASFAAALDAPGPLSPLERLAVAERWTWDALLDRMMTLLPPPARSASWTASRRD